MEFEFGPQQTCTSAVADHIFTARKRSLGQGNVFTPVCHSVHGEGGEGSAHPPTPVADPPRQTPKPRNSTLTEANKQHVHLVSKLLIFYKQINSFKQTLKPGLHSSYINLLTVCY